MNKEIVKVVHKYSLGLFEILAAIFITLKLSGIGIVATWSWWAVLSPIWAPIVFAVVFVILVCSFVYIADKF